MKVCSILAILGRLVQFARVQFQCSLHVMAML